MASLFDKLWPWRDATKSHGPTDDPKEFEDFSTVVVTRRQPSRRGDKGKLAAYHQSPMFHAVCNLVADNVAATKWQLQEGGEPVTDHPFWALYDRPSGVMSGHTHRMLQQLYLDLTGEAFDLVFARDDSQPDAAPFALYPIPPTAVTKEVDRNNNAIYQIRLGDLEQEFGPEDIIEYRRPNLHNPYDRGRGTGSVLADEVETTEYIAQHIKSEFYNGARPDFVAYVPGASEDQLARYKSTWLKRFQGAARHGAPAFLGVSEDEFSLKDLSRKPKDMQASELRKQSEDLVRKVFSVPPEMVGQVENSNRATIDAAFSIFARVSLTPRLRFWQTEWAARLLPRIDEDADRLTLDFVSPVPEDRAHQRALMEKHPYAFLVNEIRETAGLPPRTDGNVYPRPPEAQMRFEPAGDIEGEQQARSADDPRPRYGNKPILRIIPGGAAKQQDVAPEAARIAEALQPEELQHDLEPEFEESIREWAQETLATLPGVDVAPGMQALNPFVRDFVDQWGAEYVTNINETTRADIAARIDRGIKEGLNPRDTARIIRDELGEYLGDRIPNRAELIARTEQLRAANFGTYQAHKVSGVVDRRRWLATFDNRTRASHMDLHGQEAGIDEEFEIAGATAKYPGDFGVPGEDCNCRCTTRAVFDTGDKSVSDDETYWRAFDDRLARAETAYADTVADALRDQIKRSVMPLVDQMFPMEMAS